MIHSKTISMFCNKKIFGGEYGSLTYFYTQNNGCVGKKSVRLPDFIMSRTRLE